MCNSRNTTRNQIRIGGTKHTKHIMLPTRAVVSYSSRGLVRFQLLYLKIKFD
jgi:hypothetical protein